MNKFRAIKTKVDGVVFASRREATRYCELKMLQAGKAISSLELQPSYSIDVNGHHICKVVLDFRYYDNQRRILVIEDSKGMDNPLSRLKRKLVEAHYGIKVTLV